MTKAGVIAQILATMASCIAPAYADELDLMLERVILFLEEVRLPPPSTAFHDFLSHIPPPWITSAGGTRPLAACSRRRCS